jgi:hypothetical protein
MFRLSWPGSSPRQPIRALIRYLVAFSHPGDLFIRAKHLFVGAKIPQPEIVQFDYA